jgi:hypothetical protein
MIRRLTLMAALLALAACGGERFAAADDDDDGDTGGNDGIDGSGGTSDGGTGGSGVAGAVSSGGTSMGGTGNTGGGTGSDGGNSAECDSLWRDYLPVLESARRCTADGLVQCNAEKTLPGPCGCPVLVNTESIHYEEAVVKYETFTQAGCVIDGCGAECVQGTTAACVAADGVYSCDWLL